MYQRLRIDVTVVDKINDFSLSNLLHMDQEFYQTRIWPHMFYMPFEEMWRWKMNTARAMGNTLDPRYIPDLIKGFEENKDERIKSMIAWALGRIGGKISKNALVNFSSKSEGRIKDEIELALNMIQL